MANETVFTGDFMKKKKWFPTLLIIFAIVFPILAFVFNWMAIAIAIVIAVIVLILAIILLSINPKNALAITPNCIRIKQGKKFYWIPISQITYIDIGKKNSVGIGTAQKLFRIKNLKNQLLVYANIARLIGLWQDKLPKTPEFSLSAVLTPTGYSPAGTPVYETSAPAIAVSEIPVTAPATAEEKMNHNKMLFEKGEITEAEKNARNYAILKEEFPEMY